MIDIFFIVEIVTDPYFTMIALLPFKHKHTDK